MRRSNFEKLVRTSLEALPKEFLHRIDNVDVLVRRWPTPSQLAATDAEPGETLLGIYEGIPLTERASYNMVPPDTITIFQGPIEAFCATPEETVEQVRQTVIHELAHHFGITDDQLHAWGIG
jgi:predicted Zn-dependent protease with MMP-like domain